jgi:ADP-ribosylarginine hydrolase
MGGKAPGNTCRRSIDILNTEGTNWKEIPFSEKAGGCGAAMRSACIGLYFHDDIRKTISLAIETGRTTHNCPIGYLGSMVAAYFTALAINNVHPNEWLSKLLKEGFPLSRQYI